MNDAKIVGKRLSKQQINSRRVVMRNGRGESRYSLGI